MSALIKGIKLASNVGNRTPMLLFTAMSNRKASHWNKDLKPGPYPKTEEERVAAAKKYNLLREDYEPYPDDGMGFGDYPHLPDVPVECKDPYYPYDLPEFKRNFSEPVHAHVDTYSEDRTRADPFISHWWMLLSFSAAVFGSLAFYYWMEDKRIYRPVTPKQLPGGGKVHYTFERN
ncbi:NADH dehydrogenase [ubiquinone] 1 beta subcomplex subunit 8, mitochondrial [Pseudolycoriella hygida]|uniref:NADH dehydrogenase [ubiquinone] 1 beta subcomplex subunit 8, mitochondrial n=1 Tax=Pseudolycoriella hygida TaxID=35572 RepID=A0A9Q0RV95_9DIPT|nr:NADH dehydrogenase [ubiquinone] 1 beta subcomplex subunit 8, mitochondrial [Pseudolycoriella hygida]